MEDGHDRNEHFGADIRIEVHKVLETHVRTLLKRAVEELLNFFDVSLAGGEVGTSAFSLVVESFLCFNCRQLEVAATLQRLFAAQRDVVEH